MFFFFFFLKTELKKLLTPRTKSPAKGFGVKATRILGTLLGALVFCQPQKLSPKKEGSSPSLAPHCVPTGKPFSM